MRRREFILGTMLLACKKAREVTVYTSVDQVFAEPVFRDFDARGIKTKAVFDTEETKSTGVLNRLIAEADHPQADVFWSGDPVRPFSLVKRGLALAYTPTGADAIPATFRAAEWTGTAARARILLVNTNLVKEMPKSIRDLADPKWKGKTAMASPLFGTTTMHVAALFSVWGEAKTKSFLGDLKTNEAKIASSNGEVKRLVATGDVAFGLTDTDDAHEAIEEKSPVAVVYPDQDDLGTLVMPTTVVVIKNGPHPEEAKKLADWLVSADVEKKLAESAAHMPLRADVAAPSGMKRIADLRAMQVDYAKVASEMEANQPWLRQWAGM